jgi:hypothetical protein
MHGSHEEAGKETVSPASSARMAGKPTASRAGPPLRQSKGAGGADEQVPKKNTPHAHAHTHTHTHTYTQTHTHART